MNFLYLIKKLFNFDLYQKYRYHIKVEKDQKEVYWLFKALDQMMDKFQKDITYEDFALWVQVNLGNNYAVFLDLIKHTDVSDDILEETLRTVKERSLSYELAQLSLAVSEGKEPIEKIKELVDRFDDLAEETQTSPFVTTSLAELYDDAYRKPGLRWRLRTLNRMLGSLRPGDFGFIFARPETGKTTFLASEVTYFAEQADRPILWFNNEEQGKKVMLRCIQGSLGIPMVELVRDLRGNQDRYNQQTHDNLKIIDNAGIHKNDIRALVKEYNPAAVVVDQLDKVKGFSNDRDDLKLGMIYTWHRELAKEYETPVIGVTQSDASGEGKKYLTMDNVAGAKTAKQAEADWIMGIGKTHEAGLELVRHLNVCKNKLLGDEDSDPAMRHGKADVLIQPDRARYEDFRNAARQ